MKLYPMKFEPILKSIIWGGNEICKFKGIQPEQKGIGESWEVSGVEGNISVVANGTLKGKALDQLIGEFKSKLVGNAVFDKFGTTFPLLIKFIDAKDDLSIQVHPDDKLAKERHNSFGKTEMWYVVNASEGASLYSGFAKQMTPETYVKSISKNNFMDYLKKYEVKKGDVFFLPAGRVHAIGAGTFVAEIQQTSNITYRIYDYNRLGVDGKPRELHTELAKEAIDYTLQEDYRTQYTPEKNEAVELESCQYFTTNLLDLSRNTTRLYKDIDSFVIYICMGGSCQIGDNKGNVLHVGQGDSILIPADTEDIIIKPNDNVLLLETYI